MLSVTLSGLMMVNSLSNFMIVAEDGNTAENQEETVSAEEPEQADETVPEVSSEDIKETDKESEPEITEEPVQESTPEPEPTTEPAEETPAVPEETEEPEPVYYALTFSASENGGIVLSSSKPADGSNAKISQTQKIENASQLVTVWAWPNPGYEFDHWEKNNQAFETKEAAKIQAEDLKILNNDSFTAVFKQKVPAKEEEPEPAEIQVEETSSVNAAMAEASDTWTVTFYNRDALVHQTASVKKGQPIGDQLPAVIEREDYNAYWAIGEIVQGGQGKEIRVTGARIDASWIPEADTVLVPDYDLIAYTVTFYTDENKTDVLETKTVDVNTSYCLNDIPAVPQKTGYTGKWVYSGGDFNNSVAMKENTDVWASYGQNVFTVVFKVEDETYQTDTYYYGDTLTLPAAPVVTGRDFAGWYADGTKYEGGEAVTSDLTLTAAFEDQYRVDFVIVNDAGEETIYLTQHFDSAGETISQLPQAPFAAGKEFLRWVNRETGEEITADTVINGNITAVAEFRKLKVYNIEAEYYYESLNNPGREVIFNIDDIQVEEHELPYTITAPSSTQTDEDEVPKAPIYYPENPTAEIKKEDFGDGDTYKVRFKYIPFTATYDYVYLLKNLDGSGYTEIDRTEDVNGVLGSYVTPAVKTFDYAVLENAEGATIIQAEGQELKVYYTRKNFQLTYDTQGGSYVGGVTVPYGTVQTVTSTTPNREGYTFGGWYLDAACTQPAGSSVTVEQNTTLYAKWNSTNVDYTIVYMFEKYDDTGTEASYVYDNSTTRSAAVGSTVYANNAPAITRTGWERDTEKNNSSSAVIAADGSTVLYVYYKLREYTFYFNAGTYSSGWNSYNVNANLVGKNSSGTGTLSYTMTVKLGQNISSLWPGNVTGTYRTGGWWPETYSVDFNGWRPAGSNTRYVTKRTTVTEDMLPTNGTTLTYTAQWTGNANTYTVNYWLQNADNDDYTLSEEYSQTYTSSSGNLSAKEISGYTYDHGNSGAQGVTTYNFYYNRDRYRIDYFNGAEKIRTIDDVKFDATITSNTYNWTPAPEQCGVDSDYTFEGWYSDSGLTAKYTFNKMPASNLVLYAKWSAPTYTVSFVDGDSVTTKLADDQEVEKYKKAAVPAETPVKSGYVFDGWYSSADGTDLYDFGKQITEDTTVYAHWLRKTLSYTVHYISEDGEKLADDKVVSHPNLEVGQSVTESALAIAGYRPDKNSATVTLSETDSENEITFVYSSKTETTGYTVRYILDPEEYPGNIRVAADKVVTDISGNVASHIETAVEVDYEALYAAHQELKGIEFFPDAVEKTLVLTAHEESNILTFYYSGFKNATVTVRFVDMDNQPIAADDVRSMKVGNTFTLSRTPIAGWELNKAVEGESYNGTEAGNSYKITESVTAHGLTFTLFYQKKATITAVSLSRQYNGTVLSLPESLTDQVMTEGLLDGDTLTSVSFTYTNNDSSAPEGRLNAGVATVKPGNAVISGHTSSNYYAIRYISGTLEVTKINVTIRIEPDRWTGNVYDGTEKKTGFTNASKSVGDYIIISHEGYKNSYLSQIWDAVKAKAVYDESASGLHYYGIAQKDAGDYAFNVGVTLADLPADPNYSVSLFIRPGRLQILTKDVTVTTGSAEKTYDGTPLTENTITVEGIVAGETYKAETTGTITNPGSTDNTYSITWAAEGNTYTAKHSNYNVTHNLGTLTVNEAMLKVTVKDTEKVYNGSEQEGLAFSASVTGTGNIIETDDYIIEGLGKDDVLTITYTPAKGTNAGTYTGSFAESYTITRDGNDVKASYGTPTFTAGKLTITPKEVTIEADNKHKRYDNDPSTDPALTATVTGAVEGETINYTLSREEGQNAGEYTITVTAGENPNYTVKTKNGTFTIVPEEVTITADDKTKVYDNNASTDPALTATVTGAAEGETISYTLSREAGQNAGEYTITVTAGENPNYTVKTVDGTFTITPKEITIEADDKTKVYDNDPSTDPALTATVTGAAEGDTINYTLSRTAGQNVGEYTITVTAGENPNYTVKTEGGTFTITPADLKVAVTGNTDTKTYNGSEQSVSGYTISIPEGSTLTEAEIKGPAQAAAKGTDAGTYAMGLTADAFSTENRNYNVTFTVTDGWLKITKAPLAITVKDQTYDYNGKLQGENNAVYTDAAKVTVTGLQGTDALTGITLNGQETNAGEYPAKITAADAVIGEKTANYEITYTPGKLTIKPIDVTVTITGHNNTTTYDGVEHSVSGYDVEISNPLYKVSDFTFSGTASAARTEVGTTNMNLTAEQFVNNNTNFGTVTFNVTDGYQTITPVDEIVVTITGHHNTNDYDGTEHITKGYDVSINNPLYKVTDFTFSGTAEAKRTDAGTTNMGLTPDQFTNTNTNFKKVTFVVTDGYQTINPINVTVTITGANNTADYDGAEHTVTGYTATASTNLYDVTKDFTFSGTAEAKRTEVGTTNMGLAADQFTNTNPNFKTVTFNVTDGYQTIDPINVTVTIVGANNTTDYDGAEHTVSGYTATKSEAKRS